jgi:Ras-related protein Rab-8A
MTCQILIGNKCDAPRAVATAQGQAMAKEFGVKFFETSAKSNFQVEEVPD